MSMGVPRPLCVNVLTMQATSVYFPSQLVREISLHQGTTQGVVICPVLTLCPDILTLS